MQGNIKFSIIVPVYNVERYVERCIDSIVAQTYPAYEIICVNDGSTDGSLEVLQRLADGHPSIKIIDQANKGLGGARNSGVAQATGDYIWFIDSDDWIEPDSLSSLSQLIVDKKNPGIVLFDVNKTDGEEKKPMDNLFGYKQDTIPVDDYARTLLLHRGHYFACGKVFRRDRYISSGFRFPKGFYEDVALLPYYAKMADTVYYLHKPLYNYYMRPGSIMKTYDQRVLDVYQIYDSLLQVFNSQEWNQALAHFFYVISIKRRKILKLIPNKSVRKRFWKYYDFYQKRWKYFSPDCLLNPYLNYKEKLQIIYYFIFRL